MADIPEFYTGAPVEPQDLWFRDALIERLWDVIRRQHVLLVAPRRTGKTSVMNHLLDQPRHDHLVVYQNVQDLAHPADLFQTILDNFFDKHPDAVRKMATGGWKLLHDACEKISNKVESVGAGGFKMVLRESDPAWKTNWKKHGQDLLREIRRINCPVLLIIDELPDMILNLRKEEESLLLDFLAWFRVQRQRPPPTDDSIRWLVGGSINLAGTLDQIHAVDTINDFSVEPLPVLSAKEVQEFVKRMLQGRGVAFSNTVPRRVATRLGRPIPLFLQMATQDLYRLWKTHKCTLTSADVNHVFDALVTSLAAQDKLQHYHSRIDQYYHEPRRTAAHVILSQLSQSGAEGLSRRTLEHEFTRSLEEMGQSLPVAQRKREFHQLLRDLENDFYIGEIETDAYDFASGLMKAWWKKYYA